VTILEPAALKEIHKFEAARIYDEFAKNICTYDAQDDGQTFTLVFSNFFGELFYKRVNANDYSESQYARESCNSHITAITSSPLNSASFCTGDAEGSLRLWSMGRHLELIREKQEAHVGAINNAIWVNEHEVMTTGSDDAFKIFDINTMSAKHFVYFKDSAITSLENQSQSNNTLTGHINGTIRLFDDRLRNKTTSKVFKSHNNFVSRMKFNPGNSSIFVSSDYTGKVKVWDLRADFPLYSITCHDEEKIFDLMWTGLLIRQQDLLLGRCR
jgi:WD40 repeat protein